jgi:hypothetical protein
MGAGVLAGVSAHWPEAKQQGYAFVEMRLCAFAVERCLNAEVISQIFIDSLFDERVELHMEAPLHTNHPCRNPKKK